MQISYSSFLAKHGFQQLMPGKKAVLNNRCELLKKQILFQSASYGSNLSRIFSFSNRVKTAFFSKLFPGSFATAWGSHWPGAGVTQLFPTTRWFTLPNMIHTFPKAPAVHRAAPGHSTCPWLQPSPSPAGPGLALLLFLPQERSGALPPSHHIS